MNVPEPAHALMARADEDVVERESESRFQEGPASRAYGRIPLLKGYSEGSRQGKEKAYERFRTFFGSWFHVRAP
jgi:hypothetical protein